MCGICGFVGFKNIDLIHKMTNVLKHRGPDSQGYYINENPPYVSFGVTRLKVIDLLTGDQPIYNEDKTKIIIFNGEIYNFEEIRKEMEIKGHRFYTRTDTEAILHLYEEYKEKCLEYLEGMFAFAIWDEKNKKLFLARDHTGIKPLYYTFQNQSLIFASELKSILQYQKPQINFLSLDLYLSFLYVPTPLTIFDKIYKLPPAHYLIWQNEKIEIKQYWDLEIEPYDKNEDFYIQQLQEILQETIRKHLISDVPLGVFLSGGIDSSTVVAFSSKFVNNLKTFTIGYEAKYSSFSEFEKARVIAKKFNCQHNEYILEPKFLTILPELVKHFDEPFADSSAIPTYLVSKVAREKITVALSGIGGDELFGGYPRYLGAKLSILLDNIPFVLKYRISKFANFFPEAVGPFNWPGRIKRFLKYIHLPFNERYERWVSTFTPELKEKLYTKEFSRYLLESKKKIAITDTMDYFEVLRDRKLEKLFYVDLKTYLVDDLLVMADRMSMANSLELRVPFCDKNLVEFFAKLPFSFKIKNFTFKYLIKKTLENILPKEILQQKKMGFVVPLAQWLIEELSPRVNEFIKRKEYSDYLNYETIMKMWHEFITGKRNYSDHFWSLLIFDSWKNVYNIEL